MILYKSKITKNISNEMLLRYVIRTYWFGIELTQEYCNNGTNDKWQMCNPHWAISLTKHWYLGRDHIYFDGPHDFFSLGFLHFAWSDKWCKECYENA